MKPENLFAKKVVEYLDTSTRSLDNASTHRLRQARERAMHAYREPTRLQQLVPFAPMVGTMWSSARERPLVWLAPLLIAVAVATYALYDDNTADLAELDAAILSSDIPLPALVDRDFSNLLKPQQ
jgi:Protein of unknown function (DUF3619)